MISGKAKLENEKITVFQIKLTFTINNMNMVSISKETATSLPL